MARDAFATSATGASNRLGRDEQFMLLLRRWMVETEEAIVLSRALLRSSGETIELLERLQPGRSSNCER
jgi:hypothetical protein